MEARLSRLEATYARIDSKSEKILRDTQDFGRKLDSALRKINDITVKALGK